MTRSMPGRTSSSCMACLLCTAWRFITSAQSFTFHPIVLNKIGQGEPDLHDEHTNNLFLQSRGLPKPATGDQAGYIFQRLADSSRPFGTKVVVKGDVAEIDLKNGN